MRDLIIKYDKLFVTLLEYNPKDFGTSFLNKALNGLIKNVVINCRENGGNIALVSKTRWAKRVFNFRKVLSKAVDSKYSTPI